MFLNILKTGNVTPIFKNDDAALCNNFRPTSLPSNLSKIFEKIILVNYQHFCQQTTFSVRNNLAFETTFSFTNRNNRKKISKFVILGNLLVDDF